MIKSAVANFKRVLAIIVLSSPLSFSAAYSDADPAFSGFMDLEASIKELQRRVEKVSPGIVMIVVYDDTGAEIRRGSGFFINSEGRIITNALLFENAYAAEIFSEKNHYGHVTILIREDDLDLALIQVKARNESPLNFDFDYNVRPGERVIFVGKSPDMEKTVSEGLITGSYSMGEHLKLYQIETAFPISTFPPGKDGPLINMDGNVIGLITSISHDDKNFGSIDWGSVSYGTKAVSAATVRSFLTESLKREDLHPPGTRIFSRWITSRLKTTAMNWFVFLYDTGFRKIMQIVVVTALGIYVIHFSILKLKKMVRERMARSKRL